MRNTEWTNSRVRRAAAVAGVALLIAAGWRVANIRAEESANPALSVKPAETDSPDGAKQHPLVPALKIARAALETAKDLNDYHATFAKKEVVGRQVFAHSMHIKARHDPFSVYLHFHKPHEGREVIYVEGKNRGHLLAHETGIKGIVGTVSLLPTSPEAMSESKHPITRIGIANMVQGIVDQWEEETKYGECDVKYYPNAKLGPMECKVIESTHPTARKQFKFHMTRLYVDKATGLPVRVEQYGFPAGNGPAPLLEEYTYSDIKPNTGLADIDFDVRNPKYNF
jgi:hypothetical protein